MTTVVLDALTSEFSTPGRQVTLEGDRGVILDGLAFRLLATLPGGDLEAARVAASISCSIGNRNVGDREGPSDGEPANWPGGADGDHVGPEPRSGLEA